MCRSELSHRGQFGAKTETMNAEQRDIFEETLAADQSSLEAQLAALQGASPDASATDKQLRRQPKREALPAHLPRVDQRIEPEGTHCPTPECGQPVVPVARASLNAWTSLGGSSSCSVRFAASQGERPRLPGTTSTASRIT